MWKRSNRRHERLPILRKPAESCTLNQPSTSNDNQLRRQKPRNRSNTVHHPWIRTDLRWKTHQRVVVSLLRDSSVSDSRRALFLDDSCFVSAFRFLALEHFRRLQPVRAVQQAARADWKSTMVIQPYRTNRLTANATAFSFSLSSLSQKTTQKSLCLPNQQTTPSPPHQESSSA